MGVFQVKYGLERHTQREQEMCLFVRMCPLFVLEKKCVCCVGTVRVWGRFVGVCRVCVCVCARVHLKEIAMFSQWINDEPVFLTEPD